MKNDVKKIPPIREFYSCLDEMKDLYQNRGFLIAKDLFEEMKKRHNWMMSYKTFTIYFNKEFKSKTISFTPVNDQHVTATATENKILDKVATPVLNTKENEKFEPDPKYLALGKEISQALKK